MTTSRMGVSRRLGRLIAPALAVALPALAAWLLWPGDRQQPSDALSMDVVLAALDGEAQGFAKAEGAWSYAFPRDHGPHHAFRSELWDLSGTLTDSEGSRYALRLFVVRLGIAPPGRERASAFAAHNLFAAGFALTPQGGGDAVIAQRISRAALGLAGARISPLRIWVEDWRLDWNATGDVTLRVAEGGRRLTLAMHTLKAAVPAPESGLAARQPERLKTGLGFHAYSLPRLRATGTLAGVADTQAPLALTGDVWMDHAWGSTPGTLGGTRGQLALNRFALQLDDGSELHCVHLRRRSGGGTPIPTCAAIAGDGSIRVFERRNLSLAPAADSAEVSVAGTRYPLRWQLQVPALSLALTIEPLRADQAITLAEPLWSGAVTVSGSRGSAPLSGSGRMDLTGYGAS